MSVRKSIKLEYNSSRVLVPSYEVNQYEKVYENALQ